MKKSIFAKIITVIMAIVLVAGGVSFPAKAAAKGYQFKNKGVTIAMHDAAKKFIKKAGKPEKTKVTKSCAYKGKDRTYQYQDFILYTYSNSDKGAEYVNGIVFRTSNVSTKEGIKIGSSEADMIKKYGKGTSRFGIYTYKKAKCKLQFEVTDGKVTNIRYTAVK